MEAATDGKELLKRQDGREIVETFFQDQNKNLYLLLK